MRPMSCATARQQPGRYGITLEVPHARIPTGKPESRAHTPWPPSSWIGSASRSTVLKGTSSTSWTERVDATGTAYIQVRFGSTIAGPCAPHAPYARRATQAARTLKLHPQAQHEAFKPRKPGMPAIGQAQYTQRAGIEGTLSQGVSAFGMRQHAVSGLPRRI